MASKAEIEREAKLAAAADVEHEETDEAILTLKIHLGAETIDFLDGREWRSYSNGPGKDRIVKPFGTTRCQGRAAPAGWAAGTEPCGNDSDELWGVLCDGPCRPQGYSDTPPADVPIVWPSPLFAGTRWDGGTLKVKKRG